MEKRILGFPKGIRFSKETREKAVNHFTKALNGLLPLINDREDNFKASINENTWSYPLALRYGKHCQLWELICGLDTINNYNRITRVKIKLGEKIIDEGFCCFYYRDSRNATDRDGNELENVEFILYNEDDVTKAVNSLFDTFENFYNSNNDFFADIFVNHREFVTE